MKKYIRTQDGRIFNLVAYKEDGEINGGIKYTSKLNGSHLFIQKNNILKQVDTIEELCDEFIGIDKTNEHDRLSKLSLKSYCNYVAIYGAIWTDKGLIYVAKMNSKGELELLWKS